MRDLEGITAVSIEQAVAAPYASMKLADAGARVIKVERPEGDFARRYDGLVDGESAYFIWLNRGKQSIALDLKTAEDRELLERMIGAADVFIQNLAPGAAERLGFGADTLRAKHSRLITCAISGYGEDGPLRDQKAYDLLVQAESGLVSITGTPEGPARVGVSICDITAGMTAAHAILEALYAREKTGEGRAIEVSLFHAIADVMNVPYLQAHYGGRAPKREGVRHPTIAPYGAFVCRDGKQILIAVQNEREWQRLCAEVLGDSTLAEDLRFKGNSARVRHREATDGLVGTALAQLSREDAADALQRAGIAFGRLSDMDDLAGHGAARFVTVRTENGTAALMAPGAQVRGASTELGAVPGLDADGAALRAEFAQSASTASG